MLDRLDLEIARLLRAEGLDPNLDWKHQLSKRDAKARGRIHWQLFATRDNYLDQGYGDCHLAEPDNAKVVLDSLRHFDRERYFLTDAVVMPNHTHFLAAFACEDELLKQCNEWKRYTGRQIHRRMGTSGEFWQVDQFDHLIRSPEQFEHYRRYIAENPSKAKLTAGKYLSFQKKLDGNPP